MVSKCKSTGLARKRKTKRSSPNQGIKRSPATKSVIIKVSVKRPAAGRTGTKRKKAATRSRPLAGRTGTKRKKVAVRSKAPPKPPGRSALPKLITVGADRGSIAPPRLRVSRTGGLVGSRVRNRVRRGGMREVN